MQAPFASQVNFLDPSLTADGKPYGPEKFKKIVEERYVISKWLHTSYLDVGKITPTEKDILIKLINEDRERREKNLNKKH